MVARSLRCAAALIILLAFSIEVTSVSAQVPGNDELGALDRQVLQLFQVGKYAEAADAAKRALALAEQQFAPNHPRVVGALNHLAEIYRAQGHYADAEPLYERVLAIAEAGLGPNHPSVAIVLNNLATVYQSRGRYPEAESLFKRALAIREKTLGPDDALVGSSLNNLAVLYVAQGHYAEAEPLLRRTLSIQEKILGREHPEVATALDNLAHLYIYQSRYAEAEPLLERALSIREKASGADQAPIATTLHHLATLHLNQGHYAEAEQFFKRSLAIREKALGPDHPDVTMASNALATIYVSEGRFDEAEPLLVRSLLNDEKALGPEHSDVATALYNLASLYQNQGRYAEAEPLYLRALAVKEKALGKEHVEVGSVVNNLGLIYLSQARFAEAEPLIKRSLAIFEKAFGTENRSVATNLNNLAVLYVNQDRLAEAEPLYQRALSIKEKTVGPDHTEVGTALNNLALVYVREKRFAEAEPLYQRALAIKEKALGADHPEVGTALGNLAGLYLAQGDWRHAADFWRRDTDLLIRRTRRGTDTVGQSLTGRRQGEAQQSRAEFVGLVKATSRLASEGGSSANAHLPAEMFETAQWAFASEAAQSLSQMAARGAKGEAGLGELIRERQDLVAEWQKRDQARSAAISQPPDQRDPNAESENAKRLDAIDARIAAIDKRLNADFPDYAALANPAPLTVEEVQSQLGADEALVMFLDTTEDPPTPQETFVWVVTKTEQKWVRSELGTPALIREVAALRCGLDYEGSWTDSHCSDLLQVTYTQADHDDFRKPLPFDVGRAHDLYKGLFGQIEALIKDKRLLIVPSGPLTQLPFQVLVTEPPKFALPSAVADYKAVAWLARQHPITVLPAVSSLKALRALAKKSRANEPYIGFGNPLLDGEPKRFKDDAAAAKLAREKRCDQTLRQRVASLLGLRGGTRVVTRSNGGVADVADLRSWAPLPETADELCDVAHDLAVDPETHLYLGAMATEARIKHLSEDGSLAHYQIVHFATHGAVAGQVSRASEPGLLLTPPDKASETDDGYLSASEIAGLKLDADWVILSACNTAAGGAQGAEALSGLARAFFYAGARSLLVSHWEVSSDSTVKLITAAVAALKSDPTIGRAEALRRSMLAMMTSGKNYEAHPTFWAPFVLVGEGGAAR
jgi:CHAT domain-containing protein/tetratricopeptide (TPR) repeat protein